MSIAIPAQLKNAFAERRVILFVGAGMSMPQLPGWETLLRDMLAAGLDGRAPAVLKAEKRIRTCINGKKFLQAAHLLREGMGPRDFCAFLNQRLRTAKGDTRHQIATRLPLAAILTTNFDTLLEDAYTERPEVLNQLQIPELMRAMTARRFCVVHMHGEVTDSQSIVLTAADYKTLKKDKQFAHYIQTLSSTHTFLFVGYGLQDEDLLLFLNQAFQNAGGQTGPHFALQHASTVTPARRKEFDTRYGIRFVEDTDKDRRYPDIDAFLLALEQTLPVPSSLATDVETLFEDWGCRNLQRVPSDGRLLFKAVRDDEFGEEKRVALAYVDRTATELDFEALVQVKSADMRVLVAPKTRLNHPDVRVFTRDEILDQLIRFERYLPAIETAYNNPPPDRQEDAIDKYYVPLKVCRTLKAKPESLDDLADEWLSEAKGARRHLSILGEFGTGKSWFARRLNYRAALARKRIPILFQLRNWSERFDLKGLITDTLVNTHQLRLASNYRTFERLNREGRLLLMFDGFDEMVRNANNPRTATENFEAIASLAKPEHAKVLLTCRTEYFSTEKDVEKTMLGREVIEALGTAKTSRAAIKTRGAIKTKEDWIEGRDGFECVYLQLLDDGQLRQALQRRGAGELLPKLKKFKSLEEFAHRPVLLDMVLKTKDQWKAKRTVTLTDLYTGYTEELLQLRKDEQITSADRRILIEDAACRMQKQQRFQMSSASEFEEIVRTRHPAASSEEVTRRMMDLRTQSSYFRREGDMFTFAHKSFLEYFVARRVAEAIRAGRNPELPLTDVIVEFLPDLLRNLKYEVEEDGSGMVRVPKGVFVFGSEEGKNLQVAEIADDFWIDKYPVTNAQYLAFLLASTSADPKWTNSKRSAIKPDPGGRLQIEAGKETHPVTGVSWYGAEAYARASGKQLPTEQQWEKASRGVDGREYPWLGPYSKRRCNVDRKGTTAVASYPKGESPYGAFDMAGNVWEWTASDFDTAMKVLRGGCWVSNPEVARCAYRYWFDPVNTNYDFGFRCART